MATTATPGATYLPPSTTPETKPATKTAKSAVGLKNKVSWSNILVGAGVSLFEVTTLGQPLEVMKTHMAANRSDGVIATASKTYNSGGLRAFWRGLIPWAWIESGTTGAILLFTAAEIERTTVGLGVNPGLAGLLGGMGGGVAQAYLAMGVCTCMKTAEVTRSREVAKGASVPSTWAVFADVYKREGIKGINKGVNAVAVRQCTNWGSRMGIARWAESLIRKSKGLKEKDVLSTGDKVLSSSIGGALGCWNHPIEVIRVEMQSMSKAANRPAKLTIYSTLKYIYQENGIKGLFKGVTPRVGLGIWRTVCMVSLADVVKAQVASRSARK